MAWASLPQGTPTNHTADVRSGFSTDDAEGDASFDDRRSRGRPLPPATEDLDKSDAQRLAEAWDVDYEHAGASCANADLATSRRPS